ncbi:Short-chain dehydrogenase/reductase family protein [Mycena indigotica]|uniref:Short-chain dehydrogenase/reductase family protein n=1 Tax=Mycena indigotica TaxID=2126181 RepID=A0A8H6W934_9AGAR|nr:Short-chain dehydrogenase/reductase family protein [Mycena indigotica]KAF7307606.1 Short-chain dehydrogenase/reductase family protein [Mycena indigotica]
MSSPTFDVNTTAKEVAAAFPDQIKGKTILVTGTSLKSIGFTTAQALAKDADLLIITGRSLEKLKETEAALKAEYPSANIRPLTLDLASRASVRKAAAEVNAYTEPLHVGILIHNAASVIGAFKLNEDKLESQFSSNHVSPFLFTKLVAPKLIASATPTFAPRVIFVSSGAHAHGAIDWDTLTAPDESKYVPIMAYAQSKIANVLTAKELTKRSGGRIQAYSLHPGAVATSEVPETVVTLQSLGFYTPEGKPNTEKFSFKSREQGASTTVVAAIDPRIEGQGGVYLNDSVVANESVSAAASDPANAERLWTVTEEILGEKFTFA